MDCGEKGFEEKGDLLEGFCNGQQRTNVAGRVRRKRLEKKDSRYNLEV